MQHQVDHCQIDHGFAAGWQRLVVFAQPTVLAEPAKGPFHNPAFGQNNEAMQVTAFNHLNHPCECLLSPIHKRPGISGVDPDSFQPLKPATQLGQHQPSSIPILHVSRVHYDSQDQPEGVNENMSFTARNLLTCVISAVPPFSAVLTLWLSRMAALGVGLRPAWRRTCSRRRS